MHTDYEYFLAAVSLQFRSACCILFNLATIKQHSESDLIVLFPVVFDKEASTCVTIDSTIVCKQLFNICQSIQHGMCYALSVLLVAHTMHRHIWPSNTIEAVVSLQCDFLSCDLKGLTQKLH